MDVPRRSILELGAPSERGSMPTTRTWENRLANLVRKCAKGEMFGNWDDSGLPRTEL